MAGPTNLTYDQALEEAVCYGWVDGQVGRRDELTYRQRFTPRRYKSAWSANNVALAERLMTQGRMSATGWQRSSGPRRTAPGKPLGRGRAIKITKNARRPAIMELCSRPAT